MFILYYHPFTYEQKLAIWPESDEINKN